MGILRTNFRGYLTLTKECRNIAVILAPLLAKKGVRRDTLQRSN